MFLLRLRTSAIAVPLHTLVGMIVGTLLLVGLCYGAFALPMDSSLDTLCFFIIMALFFSRACIFSFIYWLPGWLLDKVKDFAWRYVRSLDAIAAKRLLGEFT
jgi:hypothetical protein